MEGLQRLEYRGYDSSGVAIVEPNGNLLLHKGKGKLAGLISTIPAVSAGTVGMGHTRWATHGRPSLQNAHPHTDCTGKLAVAHNGIIENHRELQEILKREGHVFRSQTDSEIIPHLIEGYLGQGLSIEAAVRKSVGQLAGASALIVLDTDSPRQLICLRIGHAGGLAIGYGSDENLVASDLPAMADRVSSVTYLEDHEVAIVSPDTVRFTDLGGEVISKSKKPVLHDGSAAGKGPYRHFMLKEIMEQPPAVMSTIRDRLDFENPGVQFDGFPFSTAQLQGIDRVIIIGMGSSFHAAMVGRDMIESLSRIPAQAENASEFRYRDPAITPSTLVISIAQSGETVDTLAGMLEAKRKGSPQITICNVPDSEATRLADYTLLINAGPEIAVASSKTFVASMLTLYLLALYLGQARGVLTSVNVANAIEAVSKLPNLLGKVLEQDLQYEDLAKQYFHQSNFLMLGRGVNFPVALEGALKLKELSYIHAEGYQAGEMKHGPIALIDEGMPVVAIALRDHLFAKMKGNLEEVKARDGKLIAIVTEGNDEVKHLADNVIAIPETPYLLSPLLTVAPLQLLSYHIAVRRGADVDQPRNLAKTVTVE